MAKRDGSASVAAYEQLRGHVLAGAMTGSAVGWVLIVREGIAAWMARSPVGSVAIRPATDCQQRDAPWQPPDEVHAGVVRVLASMALADREEVS